MIVLCRTVVSCLIFKQLTTQYGFMRCGLIWKNLTGSVLPKYDDASWQVDVLFPRTEALIFYDNSYRQCTGQSLREPMIAAERSNLERDLISALDLLWPTVLEELDLKSAVLVSRNYYDYARRVYSKGNYIYKIVLPNHEVTSRLRNQSLKGEYDILKKLSGLNGVPTVIDWRRADKYELLITEKAGGDTIQSLDFLRFLSVISKLSITVFRVCLRGVSHNDLHLDNVLATNNGRVSLIDYDQATYESFLLSVLRSFFGFNFGTDIVHGNITTILKQYLGPKLPYKLTAWLKKMRRTGVDNTLPILDEHASTNANLILDAWRIAQLSDASSPSVTLAYYSFAFEGSYFPGERPWEKRWQELRSVTRFNNRRVLELGCNMSLLSCFLLREEKASAVLAVDIDPDILEAAKLVSSALRVAPQYKQIDFDSSENWEDLLSDFKPDVVFALNVLNWVQGKNRFLEFLGRFEEVIFEGHDSFEIEKQRFALRGFSNVSLVCMTERNRPVLHCLK